MFNKCFFLGVLEVLMGLEGVGMRVGLFFGLFSFLRLGGFCIFFWDILFLFRGG